MFGLNYSNFTCENTCITQSVTKDSVKRFGVRQHFEIMFIDAWWRWFMGKYMQTYVK